MDIRPSNLHNRRRPVLLDGPIRLKRIQEKNNVTRNVEGTLLVNLASFPRLTETRIVVVCIQHILFSINLA